MPYTLGGSAWDFSNPKNWVINKPLQQNLNELGTGMQLLITVVPEAIAFKAGTSYGVGVANVAAAGATGATAAAGTTAGGTGAAIGAGLTAGAIVPLIATTEKVGLALFALEWLKKYWYIPVALLGAYAAVKYAGKK